MYTIYEKYRLSKNDVSWPIIYVLFIAQVIGLISYKI